MFLALQNTGHRSRGVFLASAALHAGAIATLAMLGGGLAAPARAKREEFILIVPAIHKESVASRPKVPPKVFVPPSFRKPAAVDVARMAPIPAPAVRSDPALPTVPMPVLRLPGPPPAAPPVAPPPLPKPTQSAGFDPAGVRPAQPESTAHLTLPETGGFAAAAPAPGHSSRAVSASGFSSSQPAKAEQPAKPLVPAAGGFQDAAAARPATPSARLPAEARPDVTAVEITDKPRPIYTKEGRDLHIEGEVLLQVVFSASGVVQVVRVSRGLGHGLDEAAIAAARSIRFRPAQRGGIAVDSPGVVHITFALAY